MRAIIFIVTLTLAAIGQAQATQHTLYMDSVNWFALSDVQTDHLSMQGSQTIKGNWADLGSEGSFSVDFKTPAEGFFLDTTVRTSEELAYWGYTAILDPGFIDIDYFDASGNQIEHGYFTKAVVTYAAPTFEYMDKTGYAPYEFFPVQEQGAYWCEFSYLLGHAPAAPIPEPETYALMLAGLSLLGIRARKSAPIPVE